MGALGGTRTPGFQITSLSGAGSPGFIGVRATGQAVSAARENWLWHSFRELSGVSCGAAVAAFVIMLAVPS